MADDVLGRLTLMGNFDPAGYTGYLLRRAQQAHTQIWASLASAELTPVQYGVLAIVEDDPGVDQKTIAKRLGLDRSTITEVIARLLRRGYLDRAQAPEDRRRKTLQLSATGYAILTEMRRVPRASDDAFTQALSAEERVTFDAILRRLVATQDASITLPVDPPPAAMTDDRARNGRYPVRDEA